MSQQSNEIPNNQSIVIEDLATSNAEEIKGGPSFKVKRDVILRTNAAAGQLEDDGDTLFGMRMNHSETIRSDTE